VSKVVVHLPGPGKTFMAVAGVDSNDNTSGGKGSVVFSVSVGGKKTFQSNLLKENSPATAVQVDLDGANEFTLEVGDGGDGISCDQADWADAKVVMANGQTVWLGDLPILNVRCQAYDSQPFFSFTYGGRPSSELLGTWELKRSSRPLDDQQIEHTLTYTDPKTGLVIRCVGVEYTDFPAVEWVVHLENSGQADTPILEGIQALDAVLPLPGVGKAALHWSKGGVATFEDFAPQDASLDIGGKQHLQADEGRSSCNVLPFFNAEGTGGGVVTAIGWTGDWATDFINQPKGLLQKAGMMRTHLLLHPGETIRSPRILLLCYRGDRWRGQNLLRQFVLAHHRPRPNGKPLVAPITWGNWGGTNAAVHLDNIHKIIENKLPIEYYWIDAEWYGHGNWAADVGSWWVRKDQYPHGFQPLSTELKQSGRQLMLWFEPERVFKGTEWYKSHHDWIIDIKQDTCLFNLGDPAARQFVTDFISAKIDKFGLGCYRQDFNMDPRPFWHAADKPDREGMSEIRHIEGLYAFWDALLERHPGLIIDNCARGGRRIDLETIGRATPFWRTDGPRDPIAHQSHSFGLLAWVPLSATSQDREGDDYDFRSGMCSALCVNWFHSGDGPQQKIPADAPWKWGKRILDQYLTLRHFYYGDYYPLTSYSLDPTAWMAWQLDCPDRGEGMVQAFRRPESIYEVGRLRLHTLDPNAVYILKDMDTAESMEIGGRELMDNGVPISIKARPGAVIVTYQRKP
jgi:alpha-galactosidase